MTLISDQAADSITGQVLDLAAWQTELRGPGGEWTAAGLAALRSMSPAEKKAYAKTGALPDRLTASQKAHDTASATAKATIAREVTPQPVARADLLSHLNEMHGGNPNPGGRKIGPRNPTAAQVRARHAEMHAKGQVGVEHGHGPPIEEQRRLVTMWTDAFRYSNRTAGTLRDAQFTNELHRLLSTNKPLSKYTPGAQDAHDFLAMVEAQAAPQPALYRGMDMTPAQARQLFQPGKTTDLPLASWGKNADTGEAFSGESGVVLQMDPGGQGTDLAPIEHGGGPGLEYREQLQEVVTGGRYTVKSVTSKNGKTYVQLGQESYSAR